jgi:hypothetical protein
LKGNCHSVTGLLEVYQHFSTRSKYQGWHKIHRERECNTYVTMCMNLCRLVVVCGRLDQWTIERGWWHHVWYSTMNDLIAAINRGYDLLHFLQKHPTADSIGLFFKNTKKINIVYWSVCKKS